MDPTSEVPTTNQDTSGGKTMEFQNEDHVSKLLQAQTHVFNHILSFIKSMSLKCAIDLCIPDIIHKYGQPMPLSQLIASLQIHPSKTHFIYRLMRILTHYGFFSQQNVIENELEVRYILTDASMLLLKDHPLSMTPYLHFVLDPIITKPYCQFSTWFKNEEPTPFHTEYGMTYWDYDCHDPKLNSLFGDAMASDTQLVSVVMIEKCKEIFKGLKSLVDVGGGTGSLTKAIAKSFPKLECIVFDLPRVVADLQGTQNIKYVGGDMFEAIPSADCIMLKWIFHNWNDEECVKILNKCKEAITGHNKEGKVIIIDIVMENEKTDNESTEAQMFFDMQMMVYLTGKQRNEKEWANLIFSAGFRNYKITPVLGFRSLIEVYP